MLYWTLYIQRYRDINWLTKITFLVRDWIQSQMFWFCNLFSIDYIALLQKLKYYLRFLASVCVLLKTKNYWKVFKKSFTESLFRNNHFFVHIFQSSSVHTLNILSHGRYVCAYVYVCVYIYTFCNLILFILLHSINMWCHYYFKMFLMATKY